MKKKQSHRTPEEEAAAAIAEAEHAQTKLDRLMAESAETEDEREFFDEQVQIDEQIEHEDKAQRKR